MKQLSRSQIIIVFFAILKFLVPFVLIHPAFELHRDEYLYLADADHMDWGFIEMPPMLAWLGFISKELGSSLASVYLWGSLLGAMTIVLIGKIVIQLKGNSTAVFIACLSFLCSGFLRMNILFQPNFLDVFFWTFCSYQIIRWIKTDHEKYLYYLGIGFGLGMLGKYTTAFYIISFLLGMLITERRKWFLKPTFWFAMLLGLLIWSPNLYWQIEHHFPVMHHMDLLTNQQLKYNSRTEFLVNQLLIALPSFFIWIGGLVYLFMNKEGRKYILIAFMYLGIISILLYFNGKGYYAAGIYPTIFAFGGIWFSSLVERKYAGWIKWAGPIWIIGVTILILPMIVPVYAPEELAKFYRTLTYGKNSSLQWEDKKYHALPQDFADMLGWKEMAMKTAKIYHNLPDSVKRQTMIYGENYGEAGALSFYRKQLSLPEIYSDNASFNFWLPEKFEQKYFLYVTDDMPKADDSFFNHWGKREILDSVTQPLAREFGTKIILYSHPDDSVRIIAEEHLLNDREKFRIK